MDDGPERIEIDLEGIVALMIKQQEEREGFTKELDAIGEELRALEKRQRELARRKFEIDEKMRASKRATWAAQAEKEQKERELQIAQRKQELQKRFRDISAQLDLATAEAPWRTGTKNGYKAKHYQIDGAKTLAVAKRGVCADKRGLGKTITSQVWLDLVNASKVLLIAPNDVVEQFEGEIREWSPARRIFPGAGMNPTQRGMMYKMLRSQDNFIITLNYEAWRRDKTIIDQLTDIGLDTIIFDEAHRGKSSSKLTARGLFQITFAKNYCPQCDTVGAVHNGAWVTKDGINDVNPLDMKRCKTCNTELESSVKNVLPMTGTPILNKPQEMFTLLHLVDPRAFPREKKFLEDHCYQYGPNKWRFSPYGQKQLIEKIKEWYVVRDRDDVGIEIPPPAIIHHELEFDSRLYPKQFEAYAQLNNAAALILENGEGKAFLQNSILNIITRSRQLQTWPAGIQLRDPDPESDNYGEVICNFDVHESQKLDAVLELCRELYEEGERFIVWSQFKAPLDEAVRRLKQEGFDKVTTAHGDTSDEHRARVRNDFDLKTADKENPNWIGCFATYKAFGTGINLHAARQCIILDREWNKGMEDQAIGRIDRMDSMDQATVHIFDVKNTVDTFMANLISSKAEMIEGFEGGIVTATELLTAIRNGEF